MRYLSMFAGALGLDLGLERAGWQCVGLNEIDRIACQTIRANRPEIPLIEGDIRDLTPQSLCTQLNLKIGELDAVVGGPPCQAFSTAGRRQGLNDERGNVFLHFVDLALALEPKIILIENVRGLLSVPLQHRPHDERGADFPNLSDQEQRGGALKEILAKFESAGYGVSFRLYDTSRFGIPQVRERLVMVAAKGGKIMPHLVPNEKVKTVRQAFKGLSGQHDFLPLRRRALPYMQKIKAGENWRVLNAADAAEAMGNAFFSSGGRTGFLRRIAWDKPSPTLLTLPNMPATLLGHPEELRPLSVQEYKRLQTFPDEWIVCGSVADQYKQLGNAVPVEFARLVGEHISAWQAGAKRQNAIRETSRYRATDESSWIAVS
ncbi:MAG: DNA cytosine methyltransferase [Fimbriimonadaceae bacterium]|nr:DNA cytosine methyltransferase [Fimbriimonadaceae bacterium]